MMTASRRIVAEKARPDLFEMRLAFFAVSQRNGGGFLSRVGAVLAVVACIGIGLGFTGYGGYMLWVGHSGTPAQVTLKDCQTHRRARTADCSATWIQADGTGRTVTVHDVANDVAFAWPRKTVDVHIRGDGAFLNSSSSSAVRTILVGIAIFGVGLFLALPTRRKNRARRSGASPYEPYADPGN
jgi:hypothetical protein